MRDALEDLLPLPDPALGPPAGELPGGRAGRLSQRGAIAVNRLRRMFPTLQNDAG